MRESMECANGPAERGDKVPLAQRDCVGATEFATGPS